MSEEHPMHRFAIVVWAFVVSALLMGCGEPADVGEPADGGPTETELGSPDEPQDGAPAEDEISGTFGGSAELEGGCAWIEAEDGTRYEVQYPEGYEVDFEALRLIGPDGEVIAEEGDELTVRGSEEPDMMSFCQVGPIFSATEVER